MVKRFKIKNLKIKKFLNLKNLERYQFLLVPLAILGGGMSVALAIVLTGGLGGGDQVPSGADIGQPTGEVEVSVDDDPVIGDPNAPVTIVEFVDFECPFCKSFFEETFPKIKSDYIDTGKVRFVLRDLPLPFHNPAATKEALAANCARDQGGDGKYFLYHDEIFARTVSNGTGMKEADYAAAATKLGLNVSDFNSCLSSEKFKAEVEGDLAAVNELTANYPADFAQGIGTPTFIVGRTDPSGTFTGQVISGAQPFESFQQVIDALLAE